MGFSRNHHDLYSCEQGQHSTTPSKKETTLPSSFVQLDCSPNATTSMMMDSICLQPIRHPLRFCPSPFASIGAPDVPEF